MKGESACSVRAEDDREEGGGEVHAEEPRRCPRSKLAKWALRIVVATPRCRLHESRRHHRVMILCLAQLVVALAWLSSSSPPPSLPLEVAGTSPCFSR